VIEGVAGAAKVIAVAVAVEGEDIDSNTIDSTFACLKVTSETASAAAGAVDQVSDDLANVSQQIDDVDDRVGVVDDKVDALQQQLEQAQAALVEVITLLQLPPGQREGFPDGTSQPVLETSPFMP
jgi:peptidoglycan hydrolase CwlO-like protein